MIHRWLHEDDILDAFEDLWPRRLARNIELAAALRREYMRGKRVGWAEANDRDDDDHGCIGDDCCNPHVFHTNSECFTAEMAEDFHGSNEGTT